MNTAASLQDRVSTAILHSPHVGRRNLHCETLGGRVVLKGVVSTYFQKQMAQEALRHVEGVEQIENHLQVIWATGPIVTL